MKRDEGAGHMAIYVGHGKTVGAGASTVNETNWGFDDANKNNVVIRRFVGEPKFYFITPYIPSTTPNIL